MRTSTDISPANGRDATDSNQEEPLPWRIGSIDFRSADARHRDDITLFYLLTAASFVESASDLYTRNLLTYYQGDPEIAAWLRHRWEAEELQHGAALRAYVGAVWPQFEWDLAYAGFLEEYSRAASPEAFEATPHLELAARCMIETGTATIYRMLHEYAREPVLRQVLDHIRSDEVRHYKHFLLYFRRAQARAAHRPLSVARAILRRVRESRTDDAWIAFRHVFEVRNGRPCHRSDFDAWLRSVRGIGQRLFPFGMAAEMLVAPLALPVLLRRLARYATEIGLRRLLFA